MISARFSFTFDAQSWTNGVQQQEYHSDEEDHDEEDHDAEPLAEQVPDVVEDDQAIIYRWPLAEEVPDVVEDNQDICRMLLYAQRALEDGTDEELPLDEYGCSVCLVRKSQHTTLPCMHTNMCYVCAVDYVEDFRKKSKKQRARHLVFNEEILVFKCPSCRTTILDIVPKMDDGYL